MENSPYLLSSISYNISTKNSLVDEDNINKVHINQE